MSPAHYMAEYVHIWYILCAPARDFACAFVCTLATAKQHTKERRTITAEKQNFLCVLCRGESHARALQLPLLLSLPLPLPLFLCVLVCCSSAALLLLFDLRLHLHHLRLRLHLRLKTNVLIVVLL